MLLSYLVTSRARRELLRLLWDRGAEGSVSALARRAGVSFAAAHRELQAMLAAGLARSRRAGTAVLYSANLGSSHAELVRRLVGADAAGAGAPPGTDAEQVRTWLSAAGAPLLVSRPAEGPVPPLEEVVAEGLALSHRDAAVARVLPLVLWRQRSVLDPDGLVREASRRNEGQALGFFLDLAGRLGGDPRLTALARRLRDRRRTRVRPFFAGPQGRRARALAQARTPALARRWGYLMNMDLESFASPFRKHGQAA
jgi:DNA-binding transcriptional ArsR family regulator